MEPKRERIVRALLLVGAVALVLYHCRWFSDFTVDDGAISFSYARNLALGKGLILVEGGERVEGYSNFSWVVLLALGYKIGVTDLFRLSHILGGALAALTALGAASLAAALRGRRSWSDAIAAFLVGVLPPVSYWAMSGLEGGLYMALVVWCAARLALERKEPARRPISALLAAGIVLTRPDGLAVLACAAAFRMLQPRPVRRVLVWLALALVPLAAHVAWRYSYYGYLLPNTFYAKVQTPFRLRELVAFRSPAWAYVTGFFTRYRLLGLLVPALVAMVPRRGDLTRLATGGFVVALVFFPLYSRGDWMSEGRFLVAILPLLAALAVVGAHDLAELAGPRARAVLAPVFMLAILAVVGPISLQRTRERHGHYPVPAMGVAERGLHCKQRAGRFHIPHPSALDGDLGGTSYFSGMQMVDLGGLADVTLSRFKLFQSVMREYLHGERRPTFATLAGFWLEDGVQKYPEFEDRYVPSGYPNIFVDRHAFLEDAIDPRTPLAHFDGAKVDLLGARVGDRVDAWLLVRPGKPARHLTLVGAKGSVELRHEVLDRPRWLAGEIIHIDVERLEGPLKICDAAECVPISDGDSGARPVPPPATTAAALDRALARGELEVALAIARRLDAPTEDIARRLFERATAARKSRDTARAFRDYAAALRADPGLAFARVGVEQLRFEPRAAYSYRFEGRLERAIRAFHLAPTEATFTELVVLARAADRPEAAAAAYRATRMTPSTPSAQLELAESLARAGYPEVAGSLFPLAVTAAPELARSEGLARLVGRPVTPVARTIAPVPCAPGLALVDAWARLTASGRVELSIVLRRTAATATSVQVADRLIPFDRAPSTWDADEEYVHSVELSLGPGTTPIRVGEAQLSVEIEPFTQDFENGAVDGWQRSGAAFNGAPTRFRLGDPATGVEGNYFVRAGVPHQSHRGELRSPVLAADVDEVCVLLAGATNSGGVRLEPSLTSSLTPDDPKMLTERCLVAPKGAQVVVFDTGMPVVSPLTFDDLACFTDKRPTPCAGGARVRR